MRLPLPTSMENLNSNMSVRFVYYFVSGDGKKTDEEGYFDTLTGDYLSIDEFEKITGGYNPISE